MSNVARDAHSVVDSLIVLKCIQPDDIRRPDKQDACRAVGCSLAIAAPVLFAHLHCRQVGLERGKEFFELSVVQHLWVAIKEDRAALAIVERLAVPD